MLKLRLTAETSLPIELDGVTPDALRDKSLPHIERWPIHHGKQTPPLAELFEISGDASDGRLEFEGDLAGVHRIGAGMQSGEIHIAGNAGRHLGSEMTGGRIEVRGSAGDWLGGEMRGGQIQVRGDAANLVGAAYRGGRRGMIGGTILVEGSAGHEIGHTLRRGLIAIGGACGDFVGINMLAGTILVFGACGARPGAGMRRGTIGLFGAESPRLLPTFRRGARLRPLFLELLFRDLRAAGFSAAQSAPECWLHHGDLVALGRGEILVA